MRINRCTQFDRYQSQRPVALRERFIINEQGVLHRLNRSIDERERGGWTERKKITKLFVPIVDGVCSRLELPWTAYIYIGSLRMHALSTGRAIFWEVQFTSDLNLKSKDRNSLNKEWFAYEVVTGILSFAIGCLKGDNETRVTILEIRISDCDGTNLLKIGDWPDIYDFIFKSFDTQVPNGMSLICVLSLFTRYNTTSDSEKFIEWGRDRGILK